jgi:hypothetical protein
MKSKDLPIILLLNEISIIRGIFCRVIADHSFSYLYITVVSTIIFHNILLLYFFININKTFITNYYCFVNKFVKIAIRA